MAAIADKKERKPTGFLIKQRAFLKLYLITKIGSKKWYGLKLLDELIDEFKPYAFEPQHSEIYRALHDLEDEGIIKQSKEKVEEGKRKEVVVYSLLDKEKAKAYKELVKKDLDRCEQLLRKAIKDNYF